ncbi:repetitive proline-rich cell wall protein 1-like [Melanaphis sacchari]|uniref:Disintegrin and metalloproteinase domain-containing protein 29 n=1 Tax=Melanaphis sacchari TaxID=742174 RepID=A0A2H8TR18_9HEMI|nr:repetitive proline-rich cell wall protein 1-like [Melanaphis sacchari]
MMKSLIIMMIVVSVAVADEKATTKQDKRQISSYNGGTAATIAQPLQTPQPTPGAVAINNVPSYQPSYLPTCVVQPYGNSIFTNPSVPAYQPPYYNGPTESFVPQYQPQQYPIAYQPPQYPIAYQPTQYPIAYQPPQYPIAYQPSQYPATYQPPQYPATYQPQQPTQSPAPYSYSYFTSAANNANNNAQLSSTKK